MVMAGCRWRGTMAIRLAMAKPFVFFPHAFTVQIQFGRARRNGHRRSSGFVLSGAW